MGSLCLFNKALPMNEWEDVTICDYYPEFCKEKLLVDTWQNLKDLGIEWDYNEFVKWLKGQTKTLKNVHMNEEKVNESTTI